MRSGIPLTFATINTCANVRMRPEDIAQIAAVGTPLHHFLADATRRWVDHVDYGDGSIGAAMWDLLTLAIVARPELCEFLTLRCDADRFLKDDYPWLYSSREGPQAKVTINVNAPAFESYMKDCLTRPITAARA
jgi:inosine-uridine nucleoside N-ribohydrolase